MKKFLLIFILLISLPTSVNADPLRNILKHTLKGGTKEILRDNKGGELDWIKTVWEKKLTDSNTRKATTIKIKYDSFTKTKTCITRPFMPQFMEVDGFMWREGIGAYLKGDWPKARDIIYECLKRTNGEDGPSKNLVAAIDAEGGAAPRNWPGYRME